MNPDDFDLDQTVEGDDELIRAVAALPAHDLALAVATLPADLVPLATGVLVQGRTLSDVSQDLGMRQAEVVRGLRRARRAIVRASAVDGPGGAA